MEILNSVKPEHFFSLFWDPEADSFNRKLKPDEHVHLLKRELQQKSQTDHKLRLLVFSLTLVFLLWNIFEGIYYTVKNLVSFRVYNGIHYFNYLVVSDTINFSHQSHIVLLFHSISGGIFIVICFIQTFLLQYTLLSQDRKWIHRYLGMISTLSSLVASFCGCILSFKALWGTKLLYIIGSTLWFSASWMTLVRAKQKRFIEHSRWAFAMQQLGVMFFTTRFYAGILVFMGFKIQNAYHMAVWGAGITALILFVWNESKRQQLLMNVQPREVILKSTWVSEVWKCVLIAIFLIGFVAAPILWFSSIFDNWINSEILFRIQAITTIGFIGIVLRNY